MHHRTSLFLTILLVSLTGCGGSEPQVVTNTAGKYKILMPGSPKTQTEGAAGMTMHMQTYEERDGAFMVMHVDTPIPGDETEEQIQGRLDGSRDGALSNIGGKFLSESRIKLADKHHGREFRGEITKPKKGIVTARVYLVGNRLYQVMALGTQDWVDRDVIKKCLNSFELLP